MSSVNTIPEGWMETTLNDVVSILGDGLHGTPQYSDDEGDYYFINGNNLTSGRVEIKSETKKCSADEYKKYKKNLNDRTILVSINGTLGNFAFYNNEKCILGKSACYFNIKESIDKRYIGYIVQDQYFQKYIERLAGGTTIKNVSLKTMREFPFIIPKDLNEQKSIAAILTAFDDKIELLQAQNKTLEETAQTIFKECFGKYQFGDELPEGWREGKLGEVTIHVKDNIKPFDNPEKQYVHFSLPSYDDGLKPVVEKGNMIKSNKYAVVSDSFLVSKLNPFTPRIWTIYESEENYICSTEFQVVKPISELYFTIIHCFLNSDDFTKELSQKIKGTSSSHQRVNPQDIFDVKLIIPNNTDLVKFDECLKPILQKKNINHTQIQTLTQTRDELLPKLMSGEIRVNEFK